ncbi:MULTISPECIES: DsrE family protein [Streptomyces]|nr:MULTISPECIES: DsrE family protein [Streptomyces]MYU15891.1 hypothetical protein [Streptomyces sp. SID8361]AQA16644.1 hypothetical protein BV401_33015 [Streptomyces autolyticus]AUA10688.1 hypothetical protein CFP59_02787 [Streptomyces sp. M56]MCD9590926.1 DsrE family protein [Streptomyces sp. 8ZJF_21]MYX54981.1 hypothetical protein [Streptomyces sp. SID8382]
MTREDAPVRTTPHLLIESRGPWAGASCGAFVRDASTLAGSGHPVQLVLVQDAVTAAVRGTAEDSAEVRALVEAGGEVWVDDFSLAQRGLAADRLIPEARVVGMPEVSARVLAPGVRVVWH